MFPAATMATTGFMAGSLPEERSLPLIAWPFEC
jgi:hypothetical protein